MRSAPPRRAGPSKPISSLYIIIALLSAAVVSVSQRPSSSVLCGSYGTTAAAFQGLHLVTATNGASVWVVWVCATPTNTFWNISTLIMLFLSFSESPAQYQKQSYNNSTHSLTYAGRQKRDNSSGTTAAGTLQAAAFLCDSPSASVVSVCGAQQKVQPRPHFHVQRKIKHVTILGSCYCIYWYTSSVAYSSRLCSPLSACGAPGI